MLVSQLLVDGSKGKTMKITFYLSAGLPNQEETKASITGDIITVNGKEFDLSSVPEGGSASPKGFHYFVGDIKRINGELIFGLHWVYNPETSEEDQSSDLTTLKIVAGTIPNFVARRKSVSNEF